MSQINLLHMYLTHVSPACKIEILDKCYYSNVRPTLMDSKLWMEIMSYVLDPICSNGQMQLI